MAVRKHLSIPLGVALFGRNGEREVVGNSISVDEEVDVPEVNKAPQQNVEDSIE